eukprot:snap_masked-scaffold409_size180341-processed-gene-0.7 protein:Tk00888 transcript:snap_masked-scaffold409_size180341-processed-gene-0.7-mRNA-1 annotation:"hypothetical protein DAPPUDRAFT_59376"
MSNGHRALFVCVILVTLLDHLVSPTANLCSSQGLCCKHRDSGCVIQNVFANHTVDTSSLPCYCDHACLHLDDCCPDYRDFCSVRDCVVSEWGPWTQCPPDAEEDGDPNGSLKDCNYIPKQAQSPHQKKSQVADYTERHRVILHQALNGGRKCPSLVQRRPCEHQKSVQGKCGTNLDNSLSAAEDVGRARQALELSTNEAKMSGFDDNDIKSGEHQPLMTFVKSPAEPEALSSPTWVGAVDESFSCLEMVIIRASHGCQRHDKRLHIGTRICIQCPGLLVSPAKIEGLQGPEPKSFFCPASVAGAETQLTGAIQKFRIDEHCFGKLTYLAMKSSNGEECPCEDGLLFRVTA